MEEETSQCNFNNRSKLSCDKINAKRSTELYANNVRQRQRKEKEEKIN